MNLRNKLYDYSFDKAKESLDIIFNALIDENSKMEDILSQIEIIIEEETEIDDSDNSKALDKIYKLLQK